jgi:hypothetical protein
MSSARNFYATYTSSLRKYNVYFYSDARDVGVEGKELYVSANIPYGSSTYYSGSTPVKPYVENPDEYVFKGWMPEPNEITGETYCIALFKFTGYLFGKLGKTDGEDYGYGTIDNPNWATINSYWDVISKDVRSYKNKTLSEDAFLKKYPIGGRMIVPINLYDGIYADMEIIGHNHDDFADGSGKSPLTFFCLDLPNLVGEMNDVGTNEGGWETSSMRKFVNEELFNALPDNLKSIIKPVNKLSDGGSNNKTLVATTDNCWLASYDEVGLAKNSGALQGQGFTYSSILM